MCLLVMMAVPILAFLSYSRKDKRLTVLERITYSRSVFFALIAVSLLLCRYPTLLDYQLNPDEGEFLSAAHKLFYNANFFQSVDCGTSGPLNIYPLMFPAAIGISPDFASSRLLALLIAFSVICLLYRSFSFVASDGIARLAILPIAQAFAGLEHPNLIHYSSEQVPLFLIAAAFCCSVYSLCRPALGGVLLFVLGLLCGCAFFSKMQSVPIVVAIAAVTYILTYDGKVGSIFLLLLGAVFLPAINAILCLRAGVWNDFWFSYVESNQRYTDLDPDPFARFAGFLVKNDEIRFFVFTFFIVTSALAIYRCCRNLPLLRKILLLAIPCFITTYSIYFSSFPDLTISDSLAGFALIAALSACVFLFPVRNWKTADPLLKAILVAVFASLAAIFAVYKPHRLFPHYLLLLLPPLAGLAGLLIVRLARNRVTAKAFAVLAAAGFVNQAYPWASPLLNLEAHSAFRNVVPTIRPPEGEFIRSLTTDSSRIFVWGWTPDPYLGSGRVSAARDLNLFYEFTTNPKINSYYQARLTSDLRANPPDLFVDAVGPESWIARTRSEFNFERAPELMWFVRMNYVPLPPAYGLRFYIRRDLAGRLTSAPSPKQCAPHALRCMDIPPRDFLYEGALLSAVAYLPPIELPDYATLNADVTPMAIESQNATVFGNGIDPNDFRGFRFQHVHDNQYQLLLGLGDRWASSKPVALPYGKLSALSLEFRGERVEIRVNGIVVDEMRLASQILDSDGPITVGASTGGSNRFTGVVSFLEIK